MNNSDIEKKLTKKFGIDKLLIFSEMVAVMYDILHKDMMKRQIKDDTCDYDFDRDWWLTRNKELKNTI